MVYNVFDKINMDQRNGKLEILIKRIRNSRQLLLLLFCCCPASDNVEMFTIDSVNKNGAIFFNKAKQSVSIKAFWWKSAKKRELKREAKRFLKHCKHVGLGYIAGMEKPRLARRLDIFPQFSLMKLPLPPPLPTDPPEVKEKEDDEGALFGNWGFFDHRAAYHFAGLHLSLRNLQLIRTCRKILTCIGVNTTVKSF
ncbi:hypothetical protein C5167_014849 [Papaver somniferum]|uniref:Uncharacterized protein n=1 Tax=Papaver somniferum TaxID=3469 RepID=A0A4Y7J4E5_PAPSO|nr:hypothetical protein C5167_014849 [Papaver somniferum]